MKKYIQYYTLVLLIITFLLVLGWLLESFIKWKMLTFNVDIPWIYFRVGFLAYTFFFTFFYMLVTDKQDANI